MDFGKHIEGLIQFALEQKMIDKLDIVQVRNELMTLLGVKEPFSGQVEKENHEYPVEILNDLLELAVEKGMIENNTTERDILDAKIMAILMPRQSELYRTYTDIVESKGVEAGTSYYYGLSKASNYIRTDRISKNEYWKSCSDYGKLEITINLSKPEKDPKEIEKAKNMPKSNYPKCFLCLENVGYEGRFNHPARTNHRVLPITLNNEDFYLQYSPYVYYNEHAIIFKGQHEPMSITKLTFKRLLDFVDEIPHYFIGSNADLPIVGGSILSHEHYQGGNHTFAMEKAEVIKEFITDQYKGMKIGMLKWPLSVIRLSSKNKEDVIEYADNILKAWKEYTDEEAGVLAFSMYKGENTPHNTITPIARVNGKGEYELDLALRNNRRSEKYPDGIFHPHPEYHNIKKENIGLIEVMGLAVLPARLKTELADIEKFILSSKKIDDLDKGLEKHKDWIIDLLESNLSMVPAEELHRAVQKEVGEVFKKVLECCGVFKQNSVGLKQFEKFVEEVL